MRMLTKFSGAVLLSALVFSVAHAQEKEKKIKRSQLPAAVESTVAKESEGATIKGFAAEVEKGQKFYELSLTVNGHNKDILMDKNGNIVEVEEAVSLDSLPAGVQDALKKAAGKGTIQVVESLTKNGNLVAYEGHVKNGKKRSEIQVGPNGEKLKRPE
jgi:Putative beta-lactamase-inhibitor-like, PepSY-like